MKRILCVMGWVLLAVSLVSCGGGQEQLPEQSSRPEQSQTVLGNSQVTAPAEVFPEGTELKVEVLEETAPIKEALPKAEAVEVYDITAVLEGKPVRPEGTVEVTFPIPAAYDPDQHTLAVYYIPDEGEPEPVEVSIVDGDVVAVLRHFSVYAVVVVEIPKFNLAVHAEASLKDGQKYFSSDTNLKFAFEQAESWKVFVERNREQGFSIDKDFYGKTDMIYFTYDGVKYQVVDAIYARELSVDEEITAKEYACLIPHRESIQCEWLYDFSEEKIIHPDSGEEFDRSARRILIDTNTMTYEIKFWMFRSLGGGYFRLEEIFLEKGSYTSTDGDTLGATLTFSNGYILTTDRSHTFVATLQTEDRTITVRADRIDEFMDTGR